MINKAINIMPGCKVPPVLEPWSSLRRYWRLKVKPKHLIDFQLFRAATSQGAWSHDLVSGSRKTGKSDSDNIPPLWINSLDALLDLLQIPFYGFPNETHTSVISLTGINLLIVDSSCQ